MVCVQFGATVLTLRIRLPSTTHREELLQIEALGAPSPDDAITGQYEKIDLGKLTTGGGDSGKGNM